MIVLCWQKPARMARKLHIAHIASEIEPFSKSGGLANVLGSLPKAHKELGHNVVIITPYYEGCMHVDKHSVEIISDEEVIEVSEGAFYKARFLKTTLPDSNVSVYFISNSEFFGNCTTLYGAQNENARFFFFNVAALALLKKVLFNPNIIHCHDWHTGLIPYFLKNRYKKDEYWKHTATLFTIHNLAFQLGHDWWEIPEDLRDDGRSKLPHIDDIKQVETINFAKRAILHADAINAVSETYREEIMTSDFGQELHRILKNREHIVFGIVNGINYDDYNPLTDAGLKKHYSDKSVHLRKINKKHLQKHYGLEENDEVPLLCMTSRITEQKGFRLFLNIVRTLLRLDTQIIVMGDGDAFIRDELEKVMHEFPKRFVLTPFDNNMETSLYAGSDIFLLPSRYEPCGLNQMIALRYGCIPVVHHIGGLADTIVDFDITKQGGNGFTFTRYDAAHFFVAIIRALDVYKHKDMWHELIVTGLKQGNSWIIPAKKYSDLYKKTLLLKKRHDTHH